MTKLHDLCIFFVLTSNRCLVLFFSYWGMWELLDLLQVTNSWPTVKQKTCSVLLSVFLFCFPSTLLRPLPVGMPPCSRPRAWGFRAQLNMEATFTTCPVSSQHLLVPPASSFLHLSDWEVLFLYFRGETFWCLFLSPSCSVFILQLHFNALLSEFFRKPFSLIRSFVFTNTAYLCIYESWLMKWWLSYSCPLCLSSKTIANTLTIIR